MSNIILFTAPVLSNHIVAGSVAFSADSEWLTFSNGVETLLPIASINRDSIKVVDCSVNHYNGASTLDKLVVMFKTVFKVFGVKYSSIIKQEQKGVHGINGRTLQFYGVLANKSFRNNVSHSVLVDMLNAALWEQGLKVRIVNKAYNQNTPIAQSYLITSL